MGRNSAWFLPFAVAATCIPACSSRSLRRLITAGAFGGVLGFVGVSWRIPMEGASDARRWNWPAMNTH